MQRITLKKIFILLTILDKKEPLESHYSSNVLFGKFVDVIICHVLKHPTWHIFERYKDLAHF